MKIKGRDVNILKENYYICHCFTGSHSSVLRTPAIKPEPDYPLTRKHKFILWLQLPLSFSQVTILSLLSSPTITRPDRQSLRYRFQKTGNDAKPGLFSTFQIKKIIEKRNFFISDRYCQNRVVTLRKLRYVLEK